MNKDVLRDYMERMIAAVSKNPQDFGEAMICEIEQQVRKEWAGERSLIVKHPDREAKRAAAALDLRRGVPVQEVVSSHGISRALVYELMKKRSG